VTQQNESSKTSTVERLSPATNDYIEILYHWQRYLAAAQLANAKNVLDVACGEGYGAEYLARFADRVCAVDLDGVTLKEARARYRRPNLAFAQASADELPFRSRAFDVATSFETIEHLPPDKQEPFVHELARVLKPGGVVLVSTPNKRRTEKFSEKNPYHLKEFYPEEFSALLARHFKHVDCWLQEINLATFSWNPNGAFPRRAPWATIGWTDGVYSPSERPIDGFLYVIAVCSNEPSGIAPDLDSVCFDVTRKPLESLSHDYLTRIDNRERQIADLQARVKRLETALDVTRFETGLRIAERDSRISALSTDLAVIRSSRSWRLVERYQHLMDRSAFGRMLRPIRNRIFKRPGLPERS
jgi:2-polyprenyl-3-methyl-5-hydroxy-6-metoxy-1,4-benzoquinol methylase